MFILLESELQATGSRVVEDYFVRQASQWHMIPVVGERIVN